MAEWITRLEQAKRLLDAGALSEAEFEREKARLLALSVHSDHADEPRRRRNISSHQIRSASFVLLAIFTIIGAYFTWHWLFADVDKLATPTASNDIAGLESENLSSEASELPASEPEAESVDPIYANDGLNSTRNTPNRYTNQSETDGMDDEVDAFDAGLDEPRESPPPPLRPATPRNDPASWATPNDYPSRALREEVTGTTTFRVKIADDGRVETCSIISSSGDVELDTITCMNVSRRARFRMPSEGYGDTYTNRVRWAIPD